MFSGKLFKLTTVHWMKENLYQFLFVAIGMKLLEAGDVWRKFLLSGRRMFRTGMARQHATFLMEIS